MKLKMVMLGYSDIELNSGNSAAFSQGPGYAGNLRRWQRTPNHDVYIHLSQAYTFVGEALDHTRSKSEWYVARCSHTRVIAIYSPGQGGLHFS